MIIYGLYPIDKVSKNTAEFCHISNIRANSNLLSHDKIGHLSLDT
jgi:hypothetical protein